MNEEWVEKEAEGCALEEREKEWIDGREKLGEFTCWSRILDIIERHPK